MGSVSKIIKQFVCLYIDWIVWEKEIMFTLYFSSMSVKESWTIMKLHESVILLTFVANKRKNYIETLCEISNTIWCFIWYIESVLANSYGNEKKDNCAWHNILDESDQLIGSFDLLLATNLMNVILLIHSIIGMISSPTDSTFPVSKKTYSNHALNTAFNWRLLVSGVDSLNKLFSPAILFRWSLQQSVLQSYNIFWHIFEVEFHNSKFQKFYNFKFFTKF